MAVGDIFSEIYNNKLWGDGSGDFDSGLGSSEEQVTKPYVTKIANFLKTSKTKPKVVDLGCGDFRVGKNLACYCREYTGIDIVRKLIDKLNKTASSASVKFKCLDIIDDELPSGDIVFVRQVLQHLSNEQILKILPKLKQYAVAFITEHYPSDNPKIKPNKDIVPGSAIRLYTNSGVYLDKPPFNLPKSSLELFLEVPGTGMGKGQDQGVIRTYKVTFKK